MSAARAAIADSYQRLWPTTDQAAGTTSPEDPDRPRHAGEPAATDDPDDDDDAATAR